MRAPGNGGFSAVRAAYRLLPAGDRHKFFLVALVQVIMSVLDVVGVILITAVGVLAVQATQATTVSLPEPIEFIVADLEDLELDASQITLYFALFTAVYFVAKSLISILLSRRILFFLANRQASLSTDLISRLLNQPATDVLRRSTLTTAYAAVQGATAAIVGILGSAATVISETFLLVLIAFLLLAVEPMVTLVSALLLGATAFIVYRAVAQWSSNIGILNARTAILGNTYVQNVLMNFREISVLNRKGLFVRSIGELLRVGARAQADSALIGQIPRYVFESALIIGAVLLSGFLFATSDISRAITTLILFLAAGSRVLPSIMRLQSAVVTIRSASGSATETFALAERVQQSRPVFPDERTALAIREQMHHEVINFSPGLVVESLGFRYPGSDREALDGVSFEVAAGQSVALVGPTGAGKSTLADAVMGLIVPQRGRVSLGGIGPREAIERWPGGISYVPQQVGLVEGTVRDNVALGLPPGVVDDDEIWEALRRAHIAEFLHDEREGLDTRIGERGLRLSGGQRQRLGIARSLLSHPKFLVMDEATSALDAQTEVLIADVIRSLHGHTTLVVVAHRLATVRDFDQIVYLDEGRAIVAGSFAQLRDLVPDFDDQARLLGL